MKILPDYAELHCLSNFSFLRGASHAEELVARANKLGYSALAITDECSVAGAVRAHVAAKRAGLDLIIGTEIQLTGGPKLVLLAQNREGYGNLSALITKGRRNAAKGSYRLVPVDLDEGLDHCMALLVHGDAAQACWLAERFPDRAWIAAELLCGSNDRTKLAALRAMSHASGLPLVAAGDVHMHLRSRKALQDTLTAIRLGKPVHECGHALYPNAERSLRSRMRLAWLYPPELLMETMRVAERCTFSLDVLRYEYPDEIVPAGETIASYLRKEVTHGLARRYAHGVPQAVRSQVEHELALIAELRYEPYFLTVYNIVRYARSQNILCQGRGSAANSAVCYALGITEVDPARGNLLFERFISRERNEPPDIDVDFEHDRREEVIQYVYGKYGRDRAAIAATVICYRPRSAVRDVGKALGFNAVEVDRLAKTLAWWDGRSVLPERLAEAGLDPTDRRAELLFLLTQTLVGFPRHLSQHVGGFVIARGLLSQLVPIENAAMPNRSVIQWDKDDLESLGLLKVDVLALGMLSAIRRTCELIAERGGQTFEMKDIPKGDDPKVYAMIQAADTIGVFQIESRAQMSMLPRLKPKDFYDLVIEIAIVRPGPIQGGMVHPYLKRRAGEPVPHQSKEVDEVLARTLGVPIFQEQVMRLAMVAAGFTSDEADQLRRAMAAWNRKGSLEKFERKLIDGMRSRGHSEEFARSLFQQIRGFGEYGFPESHSASFALLAYNSAWLKLYHPAAFLAGLLNSQPMGFYSPSQLVQDARRHGVEIRPVDVCVSEWKCTLESSQQKDPAVRLGFQMVKGLRDEPGKRIVAARAMSPFESIAELANRAALDRRDLRCLAAASALSSLAEHRRSAHWHVLGIHAGRHMLRAAPVDEAMPALHAPTEAENLVADYASLGLTLGRHPLALLRPHLKRLKALTAHELQEIPHGARVCAAGIVTGRQRPDTASGVVFVTLEDETGNVNVVVWSRIVERQRSELLTARLLAVQGIVERAGDVVHVVAKRLIDSSALLGRLETASRDFH
jgi:error-prone DNA polymerase